MACYSEHNDDLELVIEMSDEFPLTPPWELDLDGVTAETNWEWLLLNEEYQKEQAK
jgi:hypothetical protein